MSDTAPPGASAGREEPAASPLSAKAAAMIGALTGCAAMVQAIEGDSPTISEALHEWATAKSDLSRYVASLESSELAASADRDELQQDRSDVWRTLGIAQDATADTAIAAIVGLRSALAAERAAGAAMRVLESHREVWYHIRPAFNRVGVPIGGFLVCKEFDGPEVKAATLAEAVKLACEARGIPAARALAADRETEE